MSQPITLETLQSRLLEFRKSRPTRKSRIPEDIWLDACVLCEEQKPYLVAKHLGLKFEDLKKRLAVLSGEALGKKRASRKAANFVDLGSLGSAVGMEISLELETEGGVKIRVRCSKTELAAVGEFVRGLGRSAA